MWLFAVCASRCAVAADVPLDSAEWKPSGDADGIAVFTRAMPRSDYAQVRAGVTVCATLPELVAFVEDVSRFDTWIPDTQEARLLERPSRRTQIYYIRTTMPWPVQHRDMVYRVTESGDPAEGAVSVLLEGLPDFLPEYRGIVRMRSVSGRWEFHEHGGMTRIDLELHIEPGGTLPVWLARQRVVGTPRAMLHNLERAFAASCPTIDATAEPTDAAAAAAY
jgi:hypothetical protein